MKNLSKTLLYGAGAAVGMAAVRAAVYGSTNYLVKLAMDRQAPGMGKQEKRRDRLRGFLNCDAFVDEMLAAEKRLERSPHQIIRIKGWDGKTLVGHWFPVKGHKRIILAMHGWRSSWCSDFGTIADFWKTQRCSVLYVEQRGQGSSGDNYIGFGMTERYDCLAWLQWLCGHTEKDIPIYLAGVSMGATTVLLASGMDLPDAVRGIMADCGFTSAHHIWKYVAERNLHLRYGLHQNLADQLCRQRISMGTKSCSTVEALRKCKVPVLFIHGSEDHFVPVEMTYENYKACVAPKTLLIVPGADHGMSHFVERDRYRRTMIDFWRSIEEL